MKAAVLLQFGAEDALEALEWPEPEPKFGEVLVQVAACGINHVDLDVRAGISRFPIELPRILGREIAGTVVGLGQGVINLSVGDRIAAGEMFTACWSCEHCRSGRDNLCWNVDYPGVFRDGGYAELVALPEGYCAKLPEALDFEAAAASQVTFGTAWRALYRRSLGLFPGDTILITAAASGVGSAAIQVARLIGARVIAAVGSASKSRAVEELGADHVIVYDDGVPDAVAELTNGRGVDVVLELAGGDRYREGLQCLAHGGRMVLAGAHAGEHEVTDLIEIFRYERAILGTARATFREMDAVLKALASGRLRPVIDSRFQLSDAANAHRRLASRENVGKVILVA